MGRSRRAAASARVVPVEQVDMAALLNQDRAFFPAERSTFLRHWIAPGHSTTLVLAEGARILAYGSIRACHQGYKIGPLNAESPALASELLVGLMGRIPEGAEVFLDVPEPNAAAIQLARENDMTPVFETARMYTGHFPDLPLDRIFGITSFELG